VKRWTAPSSATAGLELVDVAVGYGVVGQYPLDGDAVGGEEHPGAAQESGAAGGLLIGQDLGIGQPSTPPR
jgi:hypothetical protein